MWALDTHFLKSINHRSRAGFVPALDRNLFKMNQLKNLIGCMLILLVASCSQSGKNKKPFDVLAGPVLIDTFESSCSHIAKDENGNVVLSWVRCMNDSEAVVCYVVSNDGGKTFAAAKEIPGSKNVFPHGENMPKLIFKANGTILAAWGATNPNPKNPYAGLVYYTESFDRGNTWNGVHLLTKDPESIDQRYFDLALLTNDEIGVVWLDNRTKTNHEGSTLYFATTKDTAGFAGEKAIATTCCQCCRTNLFTDKQGGIHVAFRDIINDSIRDMVHLVSSDGGRNFSAPVRISNDNWVINACPHSGPAMGQNKEGLNFVWYSGGGNGGVYYNHSKDGKVFSVKDNVDNEASAKHPQIVTLANENLLLVWDENVKKGQQVNQWLNMQLRSPQGKKIWTHAITSDSTVANFAALKQVDGNNVIVVYTQMYQGKNHVFYQLLSAK
jgi:hypothetical protein